MDFQERLNRAIPGGAHTYSRGFDQFPANAPQILERGEGCFVWDPDGRKYLDYGMALRSVTLGYANARVNAAAIREIERGNNLTRASTIELKAAELLIDLIPSAQMVKFAKNGSNVTTAAAKIARAYTGRKFVCIPRQHPFFSFDDWFIGTTALKRGIPTEHADTTLVFDYGDIASLQALFDAHPGQIAGVMLEPATTQVPCTTSCAIPLTSRPPCANCPQKSQNFLQQVRSICRNAGAVFILDEMITGFRWHLQGAQTYFSVEPDISTFGKGMANGFSVAAIVGRADIMKVGAINTPNTERTFLLSTTHGGEMCGLGAFVEAVKIYQEHAVCDHLWNFGQRLKDGIAGLAKDAGLAAHFAMDGPAICLNYLTRDKSGAFSAEFRTLFSQEMLKRGVMMPWIAVSLAHGDAELDQTLTAVRGALDVYAKALELGVEKFLVGPAVKPVFRKYN
jgi:glutamate-1-semialdehyde 2,1-aminomutase